MTATEVGGGPGRRRRLGKQLGERAGEGAISSVLREQQVK